MYEFEQQSAALAQKMRERMQDRVFDFMVARRQPFCAELLAGQMLLNTRVVEEALFALVADNRVVHIGRNRDGNQVYRAVEIARCDWCGLVDHRTIGGECQPCAKKVINFGGARRNGYLHFPCSCRALPVPTVFILAVGANISATLASCANVMIWLPTAPGVTPSAGL